MCRIRFRPDGIFLSLLYIEKLEEPYYPLERAYQKKSYSSLPQAVIEKQISRIALPENSKKQAKKNNHNSCSAIEDSQSSIPSSSVSSRNGENPTISQEDVSSSSSSSSSSLSPAPSSSSSSSSVLPSSLSNDDVAKPRNIQQEKAVSFCTKSANGEDKGSVQPKKSKKSEANSQLPKASKARFVTERLRENAEQRIVDDLKESKVSSPRKHARFSESPSPHKQVRFSEVIEERKVPGNDGSESSSSSDSSRQSSIDEQAHVLLQSEIKLQQPTAFKTSESIEVDKNGLDTDDESALSVNQDGDSGDSDAPRFQRQKMLSPLSKVQKPSVKRTRQPLHEPTIIVQSRIEDPAKNDIESARDLRRSKEGSGSLRTEFMKEGDVLKSAMKKGKENYKPVCDSEDADSEIEVDAETGMAWRDD